MVRHEIQTPLISKSSSANKGIRLGLEVYLVLLICVKIFNLNDHNAYLGLDILNLQNCPCHFISKILRRTLIHLDN